jgi:hypothetical protein
VEGGAGGRRRAERRVANVGVYVAVAPKGGIGGAGFAGGDGDVVEGKGSGSFRGRGAGLPAGR